MVSLCWGLPENLIIPEEFHDYIPEHFRKNERFNQINADLLYVEKRIRRIGEAIRQSTDPEESERLHDEQVDAESHRNVLQEEMREFISEITGRSGD